MVTTWDSESAAGRWLCLALPRELVPESFHQQSLLAGQPGSCCQFQSTGGGVGAFVGLREIEMCHTDQTRRLSDS